MRGVTKKTKKKSDATGGEMKKPKNKTHGNFKSFFPVSFFTASTKAGGRAGERKRKKEKLMDGEERKTSKTAAATTRSRTHLTKR